MNDDLQPYEEEPSAVQFVGRVAASWNRICGEDEELATAMLVYAVNALLKANDEHHVAGLLAGIAAQLAPDQRAGHA